MRVEDYYNKWQLTEKEVSGNNELYQFTKSELLDFAQYVANENNVIPPFKMEYKDIDNIELDDIDTNDYPDFCDAFITSADYKGVKMTDEQLDEINEDKDFVLNCVHEFFH